jgi:hypothetical protein
MAGMYEGFDLAGFWRDSQSAGNGDVDVAPTDELVASIEKELGYKLPRAYIALAQGQNGGTPRPWLHRMAAPTSWAADHIAITGIFSIGRNTPSSLGGRFGSVFWTEDWGYPTIGVYFADCPSGGHDMLCLDYRGCGPEGEPQVVHVDQERDYRITFVAKDFESFIRGLEREDAFS